MDNNLKKSCTENLDCGPSCIRDLMFIVRVNHYTASQVPICNLEIIPNKTILSL